MQSEQGWIQKSGKGTGDPTEIALLIFGDDLGIDRKTIISENKRLAEYPFDSDRKLMSVLSSEKGKLTVYTKGAIGNLLKISTHVLENGEVIPITPDHVKLYEKATNDLTGMALRTLGAACKPVDRVIDASGMEKNLIFIGLVGMIDPPRAEVKSSIQYAKDAGITSIMITGDHKNTAFAIANQLGMADDISQTITGQEIDDLSIDEFTLGLFSNKYLTAAIVLGIFLIACYKYSGNAKGF